jgi:hypothetical protein
MWTHVLLLSFLFLFLPNKAAAKIYTCEGDNGRSILTDQPKGKRGCTLLDTPSPSPPGGFTPPVEPPPPAQPEIPATPPASMPGMVPRQAGSTEHPPSPGKPGEAGEKTAPEAQTCSPRINPLNPFAGLNCSPASGDKPNEGKTP